MKLNKDDIGSKITVIQWEKDGYKLIKFRPSISELFYRNWYPFRKTLKQVVRYLMEYLQSGYCIYYLVDNSDEIIGQCMAQKTGHGRYSVLGNNAYVIGPYVIRDIYRGQGLSVEMIGAVLNQIPEKYIVYDWIQKANEASLAATRRVGGYRSTE